MAIVTRKDLAKIRRLHAGKRIVFCSGVFDLTHAGHALFFEDCKRFGDILVVAVGTDVDVRKYKGDGRPILNQHVRLKMVDMLKPVDYCFFGSPLRKDGFMMPMQRMMKQLRPDVYVINKDAFDMPGRRRLAKECNTKLMVCDRSCPPEFEGISTTKIVERMQKIFKKETPV